MWSSDINDASCLSDFVTECNKDNTAVGGGAYADYSKICITQKITVCPHIKFDGASCKVLNCVIDLPNFRAMLLACGTVNSEVKEIVIHNSAITSQHVLDLCILLEKIGPFQSLKIDYCRDVNDSSLSSDFFRPLLSGTALVSYLSFKGNKLDDTFISDNLKILSENLTLRALNLSENLITDAGAALFFGILPCSLALKYVSLKRNKIEGVSLLSLVETLTGNAISPENDATIKTIAKNVVDRNKLHKDINKKRKGKYPELVDLIAPTDRVVKIGPDRYGVYDLTLWCLCVSMI